jgi:hypothetical protein
VGVSDVGVPGVGAVVVRDQPAARSTIYLLPTCTACSSDIDSQRPPGGDGAAISGQKDHCFTHNDEDICPPTIVLKNSAE